MSKIIGLDLGTSSIGFAYIDNKNDRIMDIGVRIFQEGVDNLGEGENEISRNASRTSARSTRRQIYRRRLRKKYLLKILAQNNMCPVDPDYIKVWNPNEVFNNPNIVEWFKLNPYLLRAKSLNKQVSLDELGRIFYHMIQRRGFQSNSRSAGSDEDGKIFEGNKKEGKIGITETQEKVKGKTLGSYLNSIQPPPNQPFKSNTEKVRNRYTTRQMYIDEFERIWDFQTQFHPQLNPSLKTKIGGRKKAGYTEDGALFYQRPLRSQKHLVGNCTLETKKTKCPVSAIPFEYFRVYQWANTVECNNEKLNMEDRDTVVDTLVRKGKIKFSMLRKALGRQGESFQFNYKDDDTTPDTYTIRHLSSNKFFGNKWFELSKKQQEDIWHVLYFFDDRDKLNQYAIDKWGFDENRAKQISKFNLKAGYSNLSRKAINNILPFLKTGYTYDMAVVLGGIKNAFGAEWGYLNEDRIQLILDNLPDITSAGNKGGFIKSLKTFLKTEYQLTDQHLKHLYHHSANINMKELIAYLPIGKEADRQIQQIKNPIVATALFEIRKVVNELISIHGNPDEVKIELARDLKISKTKRNEIRREQKRQERENDRVKKLLDEENQRPTHENILKYKLWEECNKTCPYTGRSISIAQLFSGAVQIEHIFPWSRSLNDSFMNKTLCFADENRAKGDKTPYEHYSAQGEDRWEEAKDRALSCFKSKENYRNAYQKFKQFVKTKHDPDFVSRQLNDTRYISREAKSYLDRICNKIMVSPGQMTANLRHHWGLNSILSEQNAKSRADHRHHAIDALVMACATPGHLQELSRWNRYDKNVVLKDFPKPWDAFWHDADNAVNKILISHKKNNNLLTYRTNKTKKNGKKYANLGIAARGQLHKETVFGRRLAPDASEGFHVRKPIESLTTRKQLEKVVDPKIKELIYGRIEALGGFENDKNIPTETFFVTDDSGNQIPQIKLPNKNGEPVPVRKVRMKENFSGAEQLKSNINQYVNPRKNHHVLIYKDANENLKEDVVTFWKAMERKMQGQPVIQLPPEDKDGTIVTTLQINDMFLLKLEDADIDWDNVDTELCSNHLYRVQKFTSGDYYFRKQYESKLDGKLGEAYEYIKGFGVGKTGWQTFNPIKVGISATGKIKRLAY